jgi:adenylate cyclase
MPTQDTKRKLAAILIADVKGYSLLMGEDEVGTIRTLNVYKESMANLIRQHRGRVVGNAGDNLLAELQNGNLDPAYSSPTMVFTRRPIF